jgi:inorganic phosphate transporter, PiT family
MGVLTLALVESGHLSAFVVPVWVKVSAGLAIGAGTYAGGWRVIRTVGQRLYKIEPPSGFAAQAASGLVLFGATHFGYPVSTTHTVSGAVMGAGATRRLSAVRWGVAGNIVVAWLLTIPCAAIVAAALFYPVHWIF